MKGILVALAKARCSGTERLISTAEQRPALKLPWLEDPATIDVFPDNSIVLAENAKKCVPACIGGRSMDLTRFREFSPDVYRDYPLDEWSSSLRSVCGNFQPKPCDGVR